MDLNTIEQDAKVEADKLEAALRGDEAEAKSLWARYGYWVTLAVGLLIGFLVGAQF